jgi:hypothetical protein
MFIHLLWNFQRASKPWQWSISLNIKANDFATFFHLISLFFPNSLTSPSPFLDKVRYTGDLFGRKSESCLIFMRDWTRSILRKIHHGVGTPHSLINRLPQLSFLGLPLHLFQYWLLNISAPISEPWGGVLDSRMYRIIGVLSVPFVILKDNHRHFSLSSALSLSLSSFLTSCLLAIPFFLSLLLSTLSPSFSSRHVLYSFFFLSKLLHLGSIRNPSHESCIPSHEFFSANPFR